MEGYNSRFNRIVNVSHPNIWKFITCLQAEEATYTHKYVRLEKNILKERPRNRNDISRDLKIVELKNLYLFQKIDLYNLIDSLSK